MSRGRRLLAGPSRWRPAGLALAALAAGSCAHYEPRPIDPAATAQAWSNRSLQDEALHRFIATAAPDSSAPWPRPAWDLDQLTLAAIFSRPSLAVARAQWEVARAGITTANERPNPSVTAGATYNSTTPPPWIPAISFDMPIETAGKRRHRRHEAQAVAAAAQWAWVGQIWQVRTEVRTALLGIFAAREHARLADDGLRAQAEVVRLLEGQLAAGAVAAAEITPARIALSQARLAKAQVGQEAAAAQAALADAVGVPVTALARVHLSFAGLDRFPALETAAATERAATLNRADLRGALAEYAASQAALQGAIAAQYPDIHLGPGYEFDQTDHKWTLSVTLPLPLMNRNQGPIAEARARRQLAATRFLEIQASALNAVDLALETFRTAAAQAQVVDALQQEAQHRLDSARAMARAGEADPLTVAGAVVERSNIAVMRLDALVKAQEALGRLEAATQSPRTLPDRVLATATAPAPNLAKESHEP